MHGAKNDFILVDDRSLTFPTQDHQWIASLCARRTGVGSEGLILIQPSSRAHFRMRFFNPDGSEVEMCGNGARCVARLAYEIGIAPADLTFETAAGFVTAHIQGNQVALEMPEPKDWRWHQHLKVDDLEITYHFVNTGVPHVVVRVQDLETTPVAKWGPQIRYHPNFSPAGTNVNFVQVLAGNVLRVRTYERGVEAETLACGTGITAAGLIAARLGWVTLPVKVLAASGDTLEVNGQLDQDSVILVTLSGPAVHVFTGEVEYPLPSR